MKFKKPAINFDAIYPTGNSIKDKIRKVYIDDFKKRCENKYSMINNIYEYYNLTVIKCGQCKFENLMHLHIILYLYQFQMMIVYLFLTV